MQENLNRHPLVSIVIPVYNGEKYIALTLDSILSQSYKNIEVIVVNDGSTDRTQEIIQNYALQNRFIKIIQKNKSGVSAARNSGMNIAKGVYIAFLDADDIWLTNNLELKVNYLVDHPNAFGVTSFCECIDEKNQLTGKIKKGDVNVFLNDVLSWKGNYITIPSGILFQRTFLNKLQGFREDLSNNADQEIIMRGLFSGFTFHTIQELTWYYRLHSNNMSSNIKLMESDSLKCYSIANANGYFKSFYFKKFCFSKMALIVAFSWLKNDNNLRKSIKWMFFSFYYSPIYFTGEILNRVFSRGKIVMV